MNTYRHDEYQRRQWVQDKLQKQKKVKQILQEAQISRATLYNWIDEFSQQSTVGSRQGSADATSTAPGFSRGSMISSRQEEDSNGQLATSNKQEEVKQNSTPHSPEKALPIHHPATRQRMLLAALEKIDGDKTIAKKLVATLVKRFTLSIAQACEMAGIDETTYGHKPRKPEVDDRLVQQSIVQLLTENPSRSFDDCYTELRKANPDWTRKQIKRVYREGRLYLQRRRRKGSQQETGLPVFPMQPQRPGAVWNLGAVAANDGWLVFLLDDADTLLLNTESLSPSFTQEQMTTFLNRAMEENGKPRRLRVPDKPPFEVRQISRWALQNRLSILSLSMGKPENELEVQGMEDSVRSSFS